jgi:hypothetical protein
MHAARNGIGGPEVFIGRESYFTSVTDGATEIVTLNDPVLFFH